MDWPRRVSQAPGQEESVASPKCPLLLGERPTPLCQTPSAFRVRTPPIAHSAVSSSPITLGGRGGRDYTPVEHHCDPAIALVLLA
jgi:hypothetical protein